MARTELQAKIRETRGKKVKRLRADGWIPAVLYGADLPSKAIRIEEHLLVRALQRAGSTSLIDLFVGDGSESHVVLAREIQRDVLTDRLQHVDFYQVRLDQKITTTPQLEIVGQSPLVKSGNAVLVQILNQVEVECLPTDLINSIPVDVSVLENLEDTVTIGDLPVPPRVTILAAPDDVVASVVPPRAALIEEEEEEEEVLLEEGIPVEGVAVEEEEIEEEAEAEEYA
ncbi:MAG: 50S ribosomal protein L25 [Anaerolineae bacterium]|jgi:large subunit ribosomal protein L25